MFIYFELKLTRLMLTRYFLDIRISKNRFTQIQTHIKKNKNTLSTLLSNRLRKKPVLFVLNAKGFSPFKRDR
ncbi:hypothetical protein AVL56_16445 [Alteromonas stellipolaris]|uniref:Uncharacterized protein n=1 Tax=Alteromonas stellipolaris TaxID=233316 RepID=A0ABN4LNU6_9ALTE|nr:hypothetical protein AVL57_17720 [Alteromonas stellipolaris]AMJ88063.1 hypothetical protein AV939_16660 [Alteromonas sp. Mac1]AMJ91926.1 hypothetical protein AV940_16410 [Alteromonas sp. Mac2]AMJ95741.1 hypothetical protein AVL56_16445 [Alteromonas stellipolaris]ANB21224.1 hypothetical protein A6K25_08015 [Alteromonas stellipolaris]